MLLELTIILLHWFHLLPREDFTNTWYAGPHSMADCWCAIDPLGQAHVNDLPKCLLVLQNEGRLDLAPEFIDADASHLGRF